MAAADRLLPDLGPDFDTRWRRSSRALRRELIAEIRSIYMLLEEEDLPLLAGTATTPSASTPKRNTPQAPGKPAKPQQANLFGATESPPGQPENPFLPQSVRDRLQHSQSQTRTQLQELMQKPPAPVSHEHVDLERELRLRLGPVIETLIDSHMELIKGELRVRLRGEMDRLIAEHLKK